MSRRVQVLTVAVLLVSLGACAVARPVWADGDPASDALATQNLFLPTDVGASARQEAQLEAVLKAAARRGYPVLVAVIASASDLGAVTGLWRQPGNYAQFLGQELSLVSHARVLVAMPNGFGLYHEGRPVPAEQAALRRTRPPGGRHGLASAALTAVQNLARASGHPIPSAVAATAQVGRFNSATGSRLDWGSFVLGVVLIVVVSAVGLGTRRPRGRGR